MKGVVLAGGTGTRMKPLTDVTNKHLLPVYNRPMIDYPISTLKNAGITEILLVTGGEHIGSFMNYLGSGKKFGIDITYKIQDAAGGIAQAAALAKSFVGNDKFVIILGDNIFEDDISRHVSEFEKSPDDAVLFFKEVPDPERYGVPVFENGKLIAVEEKPKHPKSKLAQTGLYFYTPAIFGIIPELKPSWRGELELSDLNTELIKSGKASHKIVSGFWLDAGTIETLAESSFFMKSNSRNGIKSL